MKLFKIIVKIFTPHGIFLLRDRVKAKEKNLLRKKRIEEYAKVHDNNTMHKYSYLDSIEYLLSFDLNENEIFGGSIPETDLNFILENLNLSSEKPIIVLHIGNFVGVSLAYITNFVKNFHNESLVISIDPNIEHRGIKSPNFYVKSLIDRYGFGDNVLLVDGFSLSKNLKNDGGFLYSEDKDIIDELGCSYSLLNLTKIINQRFDFAMIDGNHSYEYLLKEVELTRKLLKIGGFLVLDDINNSWPEIKKVFTEIKLSKVGFEFVCQNGRIGILKKNKM